MMEVSSPSGRSTEAVAPPCLPPPPSITHPEVTGKVGVPSNHEPVAHLIEAIITRSMDQDDGGDPFYVFDLDTLTRLYARWTSSLPEIKAYYAVKCNPNPLMLRAMNALGANYDCASKAEIEAVLGLGVEPSRIIYANPCKEASHLRYAAKVGVNLTTFDAVDEVEKIRKWHPQCSLVLRIMPPDGEGALIPLGSKYGALSDEIVHLLNAANEAGLRVVGVSFHVGGVMAYSYPYRVAIKAAREVFDMAEGLGMPSMDVLDIGGGFAANGDTFEHQAAVIKESIAEYFHDKPLSSVFAEPGRFFAETPFTLATSIIGKRMRPSRTAGDRDNATLEMKREYWVNDGVYGSMSCIMVASKTVEPIPVAVASNPVDHTRCKFSENQKQTYLSTVFGPTCDSRDVFLTNYPLPDLQVSDWLIFSDMGAYSTSAATSFNGFTTSNIKTYITSNIPQPVSGHRLDDTSLSTLPLNLFRGTNI